VRVALRAEGYEVVEAETAFEAVEEMSKRPVDLVLLDLTLPDEDGCDLLRRLRAIPGTKRPPIVAFTGLKDDERFMAAAFDDVLVQPVEPSRLGGANPGALRSTG